MSKSVTKDVHELCALLASICHRKGSLKQNLQHKTKHGFYEQNVFPKMLADLSINKSQRTRHNCYAVFPSLVHCTNIRHQWIVHLHKYWTPIISHRPSVNVTQIKGTTYVCLLSKQKCLRSHHLFVLDKETSGLCGQLVWRSWWSAQSHQSGASLMVRCKVYLNLPSV